MTGAPLDAPVPEAVPARLLSPELIPRLLFPAVRACYGAALLCAPGPALGLATGQAQSPRARSVVRILGARHLAQAVLTLWRPRRGGVPWPGAGIDACHAASMLALAAAEPRVRGAGIADALAATAFTATGALSGAGRAPPARLSPAHGRPGRATRPPGYTANPGGRVHVRLPRLAQLRSRRRNVTSCSTNRRAAAAGIATSAPTMPISAPPTRTATTETTAGTFTVLPMIRGTSR